MQIRLFQQRNLPSIPPCRARQALKYLVRIAYCAVAMWMFGAAVRSEKMSAKEAMDIPVVMACDSPPQCVVLPLKQVVFYLHWDDKNEPVDLFVQKGDRWVFARNPRDPSIGRWNIPNTSILHPRRDCEFVIQNTPIPGIYKVFAHHRYRRNGNSKADIKVSLQLISDYKPASNRTIEASVPITRESPRRGGGKLLATVEIGADGSIKIL